MSLLDAARPPSLTDSERQSSSPAPLTTALMSKDGFASEKSELTGLTAYRDARALVKLVQCPQCSRPLRNPITLPCGNSLCRQCLPASQEREHTAFGVLFQRKCITCPFEKCGLNHLASDCSVDVTLAKVMDAINDVVARHQSLETSVQTVMEEDVPRWDEAIGMETSTEKARHHKLPGERLLATYLLAARGELDYRTNLRYLDGSGASDDELLQDVSMLEDLAESAHKELDCQVCYNIMLRPVTTFCGHTLCRNCMARVLDHSHHCPVCRRQAAVLPLFPRHPENKTLLALLNATCPDIMAAREQALRSEELGAGSTLNVPLFVCTLGFPHSPTFLRVFEPRYRLMLRRCLEGNRQFGILMYNRYGEPQGDLGPVHFYRYGTMLSIRHSQLLVDGTSLVECIGTYRFRVTAHGALDGYAVGNVERVDDVSLDEEHRIEADETSRSPVAEGDAQGQLDRMSNRELFQVGHDFIVRMQGRSANWLQQRVLDMYGQPPDDAALFPYWFASVLPISDEEKYKLLPTRTVRERLKIIATWIHRIESQRWYVCNIFLVSE